MGMFMHLNRTKLFFPVEFLGRGRGCRPFVLSWWVCSCSCCSALVFPIVPLWSRSHLVRPKPIIIQEKWWTVAILGTCPCSHLYACTSVLLAPLWHSGLRLQYLWGEGQSSPWLPAVLAQTEACWSLESWGKEAQGRLAKSTVRFLKS